MHVVIFEGNQWRQFAPLTLSRPSFSLCCGIGSLLEKQIRATKPTRLTLWVRPGLEAYCRQYILPTLSVPTEVNVPLDDEQALLLSGRTLHLTDFDIEPTPSVYIDQASVGPVIRHAIVKDPGLAPSDLFDRTSRWKKLLDQPQTVPQSRLPQYIWDLISWNEEAIVTDFVAIQKPSESLPTGPYHVIDQKGIWLGPSVSLGPGCVLDASKGPIVLADSVAIGANAVIQGPCCIGAHSQISPLTTIRPGVSIGSRCKIGGEVSNSIVLNFTNKPHDGFLGDSYLGEWVNLGAGTTTSNLKNTYSHLRMSLGEGPIETGKRFLGSMIGDHSKLAIHTRLMAGTYIGYNCMIATTAVTPSFVPSFTFLTDTGAEPYRMDKANQVMAEVFNRRQRPWTSTDEAMNQFAFQIASEIEQKSDSPHQ
jgi:UDP-N-acetylglucosamine diphosphorylase/glucosamine-1-phosphate N-acetyltransferase